MSTHIQNYLRTASDDTQINAAILGVKPGGSVDLDSFEGTVAQLREMLEQDPTLLDRILGLAH